MPTTFVLGAAKMVMTRTALAPLTGTPATVAGILRDGVDGSVVPSVPVTLLRSGNGGATWSAVGSNLRTNAAGAVSMAVSSASPALYRFVSGSDAQHYPATSAICSVRASDQLSLAAIPAAVSTKGTFTVAATLLPSQAGWVVLVADHWEGGAWKMRATAVMRRQGDGRTYKVAVRLGTVGSWRLRAYHSQKGLANVYSTYRVSTAR